jgi:hypothetical protein
MEGFAETGDPYARYLDAMPNSLRCQACLYPYYIHVGLAHSLLMNVKFSLVKSKVPRYAGISHWPITGL